MLTLSNLISQCFVLIKQLDSWIPFDRIQFFAGPYLSALENARGRPPNAFLTRLNAKRFPSPLRSQERTPSENFRFKTAPSPKARKGSGRQQRADDPDPKSQPFSRGFKSILPPSLTHIFLWPRGCTPWGLDRVMGPFINGTSLARLGALQFSRVDRAPSDAS